MLREKHLPGQWKTWGQPVHWKDKTACLDFVPSLLNPYVSLSKRVAILEQDCLILCFMRWVRGPLVSLQVGHSRLDGNGCSIWEK